jgi:hypothetical protein
MEGVVGDGSIARLLDISLSIASGITLGRCDPGCGDTERFIIFLMGDRYRFGDDVAATRPIDCSGLLGSERKLKH